MCKIISNFEFVFLYARKWKKKFTFLTRIHCETIDFIDKIFTDLLLKKRTLTYTHSKIFIPDWQASNFYEFFLTHKKKKKERNEIYAGKENNSRLRIEWFAHTIHFLNVWYIFKMAWSEILVYKECLKIWHVNKATTKKNGEEKNNNKKHTFQCMVLASNIYIQVWGNKLLMFEYFFYTKKCAIFNK